MIWADLLAKAAVTGKPEGENLSGGARLTAVVAANGLKTMVIWRFGKEPGAVEEKTFMGVCEVPAWATRAPLYGHYRTPAIGGGGDWFFVSYLWFEEAHQNGE